MESPDVPEDTNTDAFVADLNHVCKKIQNLAAVTFKPKGANTALLRIATIVKENKDRLSTNTAARLLVLIRICDALRRIAKTDLDPLVNTSRNLLDLANFLDVSINHFLLLMPRTSRERISKMLIQRDIAATNVLPGIS